MPDKVYTFKVETESSCITVSLDYLDLYSEVYYGILKSVRPERLNFGIWLRSSKCLVEFINPALDVADKAKRLNELLNSLSRIVKMSQILVKNEDYKKLIDHIYRTRREAFAGSGVEDIVSKAYLKISEYADSIMSNLPPASVREAEGVCIETLTILSSRPGFLAVIIDLVSRNSELYNHTVLVTLLATVLAKEVKLSEEQIKMLSIAALFHDVGLTTLDMNVILETRSDADRRAYERHPSDGVKRLFDAAVRSGLTLSNSVYEAIFQHHERFDGRGFPKGRHGRSEDDPKLGICPLARIIAIADQYVSFLDDSQGRPKYSAKHALEALNKLDGEFDPSFLAVFNNMMLEKQTITYSGDTISIEQK